MNAEEEMNTEEALQRLYRALRKDVLEDALKEVKQTDEYWQDFADLLQEAFGNLRVFLDASKNRKTGQRELAIVIDLEVSGFEGAVQYATLEELLAEESTHGDGEKSELALWLNELERLLKLYGRR
jgi:hypothetical protein